MEMERIYGVLRHKDHIDRLHGAIFIEKEYKKMMKKKMNRLNQKLYLLDFQKT
jgi:hypothetical protein